MIGARNLQSHLFLWAALTVCVALNVTSWFSVRHVEARWTNTPPVPSLASAKVAALGDPELAYRQIGVMLQNLGNTGGQSQSLKNYDYDRWKGWFFLSHALDSKSNFVPYLAAFYFGGVEDSKKLPPVIDYLEVAGSGADGWKWRWLAQGVALARFKMNDQDLAYKLAVELAALPDPTLPVWTKQLPAFILTAKGDKQAAYEIMLGILKSSATQLPPQEINFMKHYICTNILDVAAAKDNPLCQNVQW